MNEHMFSRCYCDLSVVAYTLYELALLRSSGHGLWALQYYTPPMPWLCLKRQRGTFPASFRGFRAASVRTLGRR